METRKLYEQHFGLLLGAQHRLSGRDAIAVSDLAGERLVSRPHDLLCDRILAMLKELGAHNIPCQEVSSVDDLPGLVKSGFGVGIWTAGRKIDGGFLLSQIQSIDMSRWFHVHTVFGRRLSPTAAALVSILRVKDWSPALVSGARQEELVH